MTQGFDIDELERLLAAADDLAADMAEIINEWERDEPRDDWFLHQHAHADAVEMLSAQSTAIRELRAENARLKRGLTNINRKASPDPERTMSEASNDLYWCACEARAALGEPQ